MPTLVPEVVDRHTLPLMLKAHHIKGITGLSRVKVYALLNTQGCPIIRFGRAIRIPRDAFFRWLEQQAGVEGERS
jgi:excisionase family DNA binding protein